MDHDTLREAITFVRECWGNHINQSEEGRAKFRLVAAAAESTLPKTKMVEFFTVDSAFREYGENGQHWLPKGFTCQTRKEAEKLKADLLKSPEHYACIRVTGPHQQEVPA